MDEEDIYRVVRRRHGFQDFISRHGLCFRSLLSSLKPASSYDRKTNELIHHFIAQTLELSPDSWKFATEYFSSDFPPFIRFLDDSNVEEEPKKKRRKKVTEEEASSETVAWVSLRFVETDSFFHRLWDWETLVRVLREEKTSFSRDSQTHWLLQRCFYYLLDLNHQDYSFKYSFPSSKPFPSKLGKISNPLSANRLVWICGVGLQTKTSSSETDDEFILLPSLENPLKTLCLAVSVGSTAFLSGPTGSGKTRLIEHLALRTARKKYKDFYSIRVDEGTDSRALLGGYVCTEVPGRFSWRRGILTKAIEEGHWLLIEDVHNASSDVVSLLVQIIETGSLYISHYGAYISIAPGFQLFCTRSENRKMDVDILKLETSPYHIRLASFSSTECEIILQKLFSETLPGNAVAKIVKTFEGVRQCGTTSRNKRYLSLRDLLKWCRRIKVLENRTDVFFSGMDSLCYCITDLNLRNQASQIIGRFLNYSAEEIIHLQKEYCPKLSLSEECIRIGRCLVNKSGKSCADPKFTLTKSSSILMEFLAAAVCRAEPVLLVGETGVGKTSTVQYLCSLLGKNLRVINMSQQSDSSDFLGAYKPVDTSVIVKNVRNKFELLFSRTFSLQDNRKFLRNVSLCIQNRSWQKAVQLFVHVSEKALKFLNSSSPQNDNILNEWHILKNECAGVLESLSSKSNIMFSFVKGVLTEAITEGNWVLLDEINLAESETLECLSDMVSNDAEVINSPENPENFQRKHSDFRVFACMNPATDVGKSNLPPSLRNLFTEFFICEPEEENELLQIVSKYLKELSLDAETLRNIVDFYILLKANAASKLVDGNGNIPVFSLRTLCRALNIASKNICLNVKRSIFEAFSVCFLTELDNQSYQIVLRLLIAHLGGDQKNNTFLKEEIPPPLRAKSNVPFVTVEGYWISVGKHAPVIDDKYILSRTVRRNLKDLSRIVSTCNLPVLIQGETSVGKTSLITYLAKASGNACFRINNHEHTDIQEYIGSYTMNESGLFIFKEGILVEAMRTGSWIILDELNLAPTEVLEALNRVLDDNRELFIAESQTLVKAHPNFRLFATQNPVGIYGGRKTLSRAFRNRFIQLYFSELPAEEIEVIIEKSCDLPRSMSKKMVKIMVNLQTHRKTSSIFEGKQGYITLRDLFRWGQRFNIAAKSISSDKLYDWNKHLAEEGYMILASRIRQEKEKIVVKKSIEKIMKVTLNDEEIFSFTSDKTGLASICEKLFLLECCQDTDIVWTSNAQRMAVLILHALRFKEPVLLVGETGCGKTTIIQEIARFLKKSLKIINCHLHTETSDFLGSLRPSREKSDALFQWNDGPLIEAMKEGDILLVDEISLADDSVVERMNSVLEPARKLLLAEKTSEVSTPTEEIVAKNSFQLVATMNPGGDFGKKELSPALRNRFFEVWCPSNNDDEDLYILLKKSIKREFNFPIEKIIVEFLSWLNAGENNILLSVRDLVAWVDFINESQESLQSPECSVIHGVCLVLLDGYTMSNNLFRAHTHPTFNEDCKTFFSSRLKNHDKNCSCFMWMTVPKLHTQDFVSTTTHFGIKPFVLDKVHNCALNSSFSFSTDTTAKNTFKLLRAFCLKKPILIEGLPGVGKSSIVENLASIIGKYVVRINLSDQTEISDLFGTDLPVESDTESNRNIFAWKDGPLLSALKNGHWILLDELNLATQSVLEGLNACLDHRGEIYIPELNKTFRIKQSETKIFGCQNPYSSGGDRKGLPKSFLNRFVRISVETLTKIDILHICEIKFPHVSKDLVHSLVNFTEELKIEMSKMSGFGAPWSINLRDITRFLKSVPEDKEISYNYIIKLLELIFVLRFRSAKDRELAREVYGRIFCSYKRNFVKIRIALNKDYARVGVSQIKRTESRVSVNIDSLVYLPSQAKTLESLMLCIEHKMIPLLVGPECCGKTTIVRIAAALAGRELTTMTLSNGSDTNDLLGSYEQTDIHQEIIKAKRGITNSLMRLARNEPSARDVVFKITKKLSRNSGVFEVDDFFSLLGEIEKEANDLVLNILKAEKKRIKAAYEKHGCAKFFKWLDSNLVEALQNGDWILLDNANFCPSSVLDRLNGLLEEGGALDIYEHGSIAGKPQRIFPHPDFRVFITINPKNGELSSAMRNRCVEVFISEDEYSSDNLGIISSSILGKELSFALTTLLTNYSDSKLNVLDTTRCIRELLLNGSTVKDALEFIQLKYAERDSPALGIVPNIKNYNSVAVKIMALVKDPLIALPFYQLRLMKDCVNSDDVILNTFLTLSSEFDLSVRLKMLENCFHSALLSKLQDSFKFGHVPFERREPLGDEEITIFNALSMNISLKIYLHKIENFALASNSKSEMKTIGNSLRISLKKFSSSLRFQDTSYDAWYKWNLICNYTYRILKTIENNSEASNNIEIPVVLWNKVRPLLSHFITEESIFDEVDSRLSLQLCNESSVLDRANFLDALNSPKGFFIIEEVEDFTETIRADSLWSVFNKTEISDVKRGLYLYRNWFLRNSSASNLLSLKDIVSPLLLQSVTRYNALKSNTDKFTLTLFLKREEIMKAPFRPLQTLIQSIVFEEADKITVESYEENASKLETLQKLIASNFDVLLNYESVKYPYVKNKASIIREHCFNHNQNVSDALSRINAILDCNSDTQSSIAELQMMTGLVISLIACEVSVVDIADKMKIDLKCLQELSHSFTLELNSFDISNCLTHISHERKDFTESTHIHATRLSSILLENEASVAEISGSIPIRKETYRLLISDIIQMRKTLCSTARELYREILSANKKDQTLEKINSWKHSVIKFGESLLVKYPSYRDIVMPLLDGLTDMAEGMYTRAKCADINMGLNQEFVDRLNSSLFSIYNVFKSDFFEIFDKENEDVCTLLWQRNHIPLEPIHRLNIFAFDYADIYFPSNDTDTLECLVSLYKDDRFRSRKYPSFPKECLSFMNEFEPSFNPFKSIRNLLAFYYDESKNIMHHLSGQDRTLEFNEIKTAVAEFIKVKKTTEEILDKFPDSPLLNDVMTVVQRILNFSPSDRISKFQTGIVHLLPVIVAWNKNAPKIYHIDLETLDKILFNWQKLELSKTELELNDLKNKFGENSADEFWRIFKTLNLGCIQASRKKILLAFFRFLGSSSIGEFEKRCYLCENIVTVSKYICPKLVSGIQVILNYFTRCIPDIQHELKSKIEELSKRVKQALKLEFISYRKFRSASKNTSYKKIVDEYTETLKQPSNKYFKMASPTEPLKIVEDQIVHISPIFSENKEEKSSILFSSSSKVCLGDIASINSKSCKLLNSSNLTSHYSEDFSACLKEVASSYKEIPHTNLVDDPKGFYKYSRLIIEVLKNMKDLGISYKYGLMHEVGYLNFAVNQCYIKSGNIGNIITRFEELKDIFWSPSCKKKHLTPDIVQRIQGSINHGLLMSIICHSNLNGFECAQKDLLEVVEKLQNNGDGFRNWKRWGIKTGVAFNDKLKDRSINILDDLIKSSYIHKRDSMEADKAKKYIASLSCLVGSLRGNLEESSFLGILKQIKEESEIYNINSQSVLVKSILSDIETNRANILSHISVFEDWTKQNMSLIKENSDEVSNKVKKVCERILEVIQSYVKFLQNKKVVKTFADMRELAKEEISIMNVSKIIKSLKGLSTLYSFHRHNGSLIPQIVPLVRTYSSVLQCALIRSRTMGSIIDEYLRSTLEVFIRFSNAEFKQEPEHEEEENEGKGDSGPLEGCGLGDGSGTDNVSSEIPDEDMLEGAEKKEEKEEEKDEDEEKNGPEEDDGIEMQDNFDGNLEDKESGEEQSDDDDKKDEDDELDQEENDVDEDVELDDDLWNNEEEDENPEDESKDDKNITENKKEQSKKPSNKDNNKENAKENNNRDDDVSNSSEDEDEHEPSENNDDKQTEDEEKRKRSDDEFSEGEELDLDVENENKLDEAEPDDLNLEDMNIDEENENEIPDFENLDDMDDYEKPNFEDPEVEMSEDKVDESGNNAHENDPKENASNIPDGSQNETKEENIDCDIKDSLEGTSIDPKSKDSQTQSLEDPSREENKADKQFEPSKDSVEVSNVSITHSKEEDNIKRDEESKVYDNLPKEEEKEEDPHVLETMDHEQLKDHSGSKIEKEEKMEVTDASDSVPTMEDADMIFTAGALRPSESHFSSGKSEETFLLNNGSLPEFLNQQKVSAFRQINMKDMRQWTDLCRSTSSLSQHLIARLRLLFEPTKANRLKGDYKSGKRLNMRKIIPYIASHFRKDKIWLKRTKVSKRDYHILFALDDSQSMTDNDANRIALEALATVSQAFNVLEVGKLGVIKFGESAELVHPFKSGFSAEDGGHIISEFSFSQTKTSLLSLVRLSIDSFIRQDTEAVSALSQLLVIISDGRGVFNEGKDKLLENLRKARTANIFIMFIIVETKNEASILDIRFPVFDDKHNLLRIESYMENFPFSYYILLKDIKSLPFILCEALQQWFEMSSFK